jgi:shikimate kinase
MHMFDYYARQNLLSIKKPLCLVGFFGTRIPEISVALSQFSGISVLDLERQVEHQMGMRVQTFRRQNSEEELLRREYDCLSQSLPVSSRPIVVFTRPQSFLYTPIQKLLLERTHCIHMKQGIFIIFSQILTLLERTEQHRDVAIPTSDPKSIHQISQLMKEYEKSYDKTHRSIDIEQKHPFEIAQDLFAEFAL